MAEKTLDAVRVLEAEFAEAMSRMYAVGNGLAALRQRLLLEQGQGPVAVAAPQGAAAPAAGPILPPPIAPAPAGHLAAGADLSNGRIPAQGGKDETGEAPVAWWQREGMVVRLLGVAGAGVLLIGVALLLAYAVQHGYLGPVARVAGAGVLAVGLIGVAHRLHRDPARATGAWAIASAGYATAYLDVLAMTRIYDWLPVPAGLALAGLVAGSGVLLARAWDSQFLALVTVGGVAALAPAVSSPTDPVTAAFLVILAIATFPAHLGRSWLALHLLRVAPAALALIALGSHDHREASLAMAVVLAAVDLGTTFLAAHGKTASRQPMLLPPVLGVSALPVFAIAGAGLVPSWLVAAVAALAYLMVALLTRRESRPALLKVAPAAGILGIAFAIQAAVVDTATSWQLPAFTAVVLAVVAGLHLPGRRESWQVIVAGLLSFAAVALTAPIIAHLTARATATTYVHLPELLAVLATGLALALLHGPAQAYAAAQDPDSHPHRNPTRLTLLLAVPALVAFGAAVVCAGVLVGRRFATPASGFVTGQGLATLLIAGVAAYLLMHGLSRSRDAALALRAGLALAGCAVAKLLLFDLATLDGIVRIVAFLGAGLALLAMGTGYARALDRARQAP